MNTFLADESVDYRLVLFLREQGFTVESVLDLTPGLSDGEVLSYCNSKSFILITEDKDFGELIIRMKKPNPGVILLRLSGLNLTEREILVFESFHENHIQFKNAFSVLSPSKLRIRKFNNPPSE